MANFYPLEVEDIKRETVESAPIKPLISEGMSDELAFDMKPVHMTILDAADNEGLGVSYSCKGGE
jgi:ferredoxin